MKKLVIAILTILIFSEASYALVVDSVTGAVRNGSQITISGSGFGSIDVTKTTWDNFEDGRVDTSATMGFWGSVNLLKINSASRHQNSSYSSYHDFTGYGTAGVQGVNTILGQKWFVQYWVKLDSFDWGTGTYGSTSQHLANIKFLRFWNPGSDKENFYTQFWWGLTGNSYSNIEFISQPSTTKNYDIALNKAQLSDGSWHLLQFEYIDSSTPGAADGVYKFWQDGQLKEVRTGFIGRTNENFKRPLFIGFFNAWGPNVAGGETSRAPNLFIMDDVYSAPTLARVEIGNNAVYNSCTHREIQIPQSWNEHQIQVTINQGSLPADATPAYLFVVDPNGNVSEGKKILFGSISPPQNLRGTLISP